MGRAMRCSGGGGFRGGINRRSDPGQGQGSSANQAAFSAHLASRRHWEGGVNVYDPSSAWYNHELTTPEDRWYLARALALKWCPKVPNPAQPFGDMEKEGFHCHFYMELLVDCPPEILGKHQLPPLSALGESKLFTPLILRDTRPVRACKMWKNILQKCMERNTHYDAVWKCEPFQSYVEEGGC